MNDLLDIPAIWRNEIRARVWQLLSPKKCVWSCGDCGGCDCDDEGCVCPDTKDDHVYRLEDVTDDGPGWLCADCDIETWVPYGVQHSHVDTSQPAPSSTPHAWDFLDHTVVHMEDAARCIKCGAESFDGSVNEFKVGCDRVNVALYRKGVTELRQGRAS